MPHPIFRSLEVLLHRLVEIRSGQDNLHQVVLDVPMLHDIVESIHQSDLLLTKNQGSQD